MGEPLDTIVYAYGDAAWGDLLTAYDGVAITYDEMGNPLSDGTWTYTWEHGRQLATMSNGTTTWTYTYDANGMRTSRSNGTDTYSYVYNGSKLMQMKVGTNTLTFTYDGSGNPSTVTLNGTTYYYITNLQGDVIQIRNASGALVCNYSYDAWGNVVFTSNHLNNTLRLLNPLLYRGYVYDRDTGLYYLQSRYYNPTIGRFLNADALVSTGQGLLGNNMFAYCRNNPVSRKDASGTEDVSAYLDDGSDGDIDCAPIDPEDAYKDGCAGTQNVGQNTGSVGGNGNGNPGTPGGGNGNPGTPGGGQSNGGGNNSGTPIFRYGGNSPDKLTPTANDVATDTGLSFSTKGRAGAAVTTIEEINASGYLYAVQDGKTHVSVYPVGATIAEWYAQGAASLWTQILVQMVTLA